MKKHYIFCLSLSLLLMGCDTQTIEEPSYAIVNSENDVVYIYGLVGETFDLSSIDTSRVSRNVPMYVCNNTGITINGNDLTLNQSGLYSIDIYDNDTKLGVVQVLVNETEENRYNYPFDLTDYTLISGSANEVSINEDTITIAAGDTWNRITYPLNEYSSLNYIVECDVTFKQSTDNRRWFGLVFRSDSETGYPYYQFDIRRNPTLSNAIELTYCYADGKYNYPLSTNWKPGGPSDIFDENTKIHMKVALNGYTANCSLQTGEYTKNFEVTLPNLCTGDFGFQTSNATVEIENIKISLDKENIVSSFADSKDSYVNIKDDIYIDPIKPQLILSGPVYSDFYAVCNEYQQVFVKAKDNSIVELYDINDNLMDVTLNQLIRYSLGKSILNIQVEDESTLTKVTDICLSYGLVDCVIWSTKTELLDKVHAKIPSIRLGYIPTNVTSFETFDEIGEICRTAGKHYANQILIDTTILNKENVNKAKGLGYDIVANAKNSDNYSLIDGALDGCSLILVATNINTLNQVSLLYNNDVFTANTLKQSMFAAPYVTGHRGAGNTGSNAKTTLPENTIESFKWALDNGANSVEIDIHATSDNQLAIIHNATTGDYSNQNLTVSSSTLAQLQTLPLKLGNGTLSYDYKIPSLDELFDALNDPKYADKTMVIEVKDNLASTGIAAIELAKKKNWYNKITIITFGSAASTEIKKYDPGIQVGYLGTVNRLSHSEYWSANESYYFLGVGIAANYGTVSKESIQESNARGQVGWLWTFNAGNASQLLNYISYGNKAFTTNYVSDFSNNNYKVVVDDLTLANGETKQLAASAVSYLGTETTISNYEIIILSDNATANGTSITRTGDGNIYVVIKHETKWTMTGTSKTFAIYSELIKI